jgi:DNA-binding response OmpR family regulator
MNPRKETESTMSNFKILIADDNHDVRETLRYRLALEPGFDLFTTSNGLETLGAIRAKQPDVILLDVMMPGENGYRIARAVREDESAGIYPRRATIMLLTARDLSSDPEREAMFMDFSGADEVIYKPYDMERLVERLCALRGDRQAA